MLNWEVAASERYGCRTGRDVDLVGLPTDVHDGGTEGELSIEQDGEEGARGAGTDGNADDDLIVLETWCFPLARLYEMVVQGKGRTEMRVMW